MTAWHVTPAGRCGRCRSPVGRVELADGRAYVASLPVRLLGAGLPNWDDPGDRPAAHDPECPGVPPAEWSIARGFARLLGRLETIVRMTGAGTGLGSVPSAARTPPPPSPSPSPPPVGPGAPHRGRPMPGQPSYPYPHPYPPPPHMRPRPHPRLGADLDGAVRNDGHAIHPGPVPIGDSVAAAWWWLPPLDPRAPHRRNGDLSLDGIDGIDASHGIGSERDGDLDLDLDLEEQQGLEGDDGLGPPIPPDW